MFNQGSGILELAVAEIVHHLLGILNQHDRTLDDGILFANPLRLQGKDLPGCFGVSLSERWQDLSFHPTGDLPTLQGEQGGQDVDAAGVFIDIQPGSAAGFEEIEGDLDHRLVHQWGEVTEDAPLEQLAVVRGQDQPGIRQDPLFLQGVVQPGEGFIGVKDEFIIIGVLFIQLG